LVSGAQPLPGAATVGGKAAGLFRLRQLGLPVPGFAVLPAELFDCVLTSLPTDEAGLTERQRRLQEFTLPPSVQEQLTQQLQRWGFVQQPVVVRSSVADEDGRTAAFPGLMDSRLNLTTLPAVLAAVAQCAASAYSERAVAYRRQHGLGLDARPAIVVQRQVTAAARGVLFTTFPEYPQELAIHAVWGFGEGLVSGLLEPDEFYFDKKTGALTHEKVALKTQQVVADGANGTAVAPVPAARQAQRCLSPAQLRELVELASQLETQLGAPHDVEFVATEERLWVVQARPITQRIPEVVVYDNANIQESYCGVTTPLTFSFAQRAYATVYRQTMQVLGLPAVTAQAHESVVTQLLTLVQGRVYYNINNWYRGLLLLPAFRQNKADMERMMGLEEPVDLVQSHEKSAREKLQLLPRLLVNLTRLVWAFGRRLQRTANFHRRFQQQFERFYQLPMAELSAAELLAEKGRLDAGLLRNWTTPIINDFRVMMANGAAQRHLTVAGIADGEEFLSRYLSGDQQLASARPAHEMQALARRVQQDLPTLRPLILGLPTDLPFRIEALAPKLHHAIQQYLGAYGDHGIGELKLETETMRTDPLLFFRYLRNYLANETATLPTAEPLALDGLRRAATAQLDARLAGRSFWFRRTMRRRLRQLQLAVSRQEELRLERTRLFGMYRAFGQRLVTAGKLAAPANVFYLTETEIAAAVNSKASADLAALVASWQQEFTSYQPQYAPSRVVVPARPAAVPDAAALRPGQWQGTGCYAGQVSGEVVVINGPNDDLAVQGKIVVAPRTDPGWAVLFPACRGVLIERGSALSHSDILTPTASPAAGPSAPATRLRPRPPRSENHRARPEARATDAANKRRCP
jgi:pyruvate,water dikinase